MSLDTLASRQHQLELYERYGSLLTDQQREVLDLHLGSDWSLSEIARARSTSRAAVHDLVRRSAQALDDYERRLGLLAAEDRRRAERDALTQQLAGIRRRLARLEREVARA